MMSDAQTDVTSLVGVDPGAEGANTVALSSGGENIVVNVLEVRDFVENNSKKYDSFDSVKFHPAYLRLTNAVSAALAVKLDQIGNDVLNDMLLVTAVVVKCAELVFPVSWMRWIRLRVHMIVIY